VSVSAQVPSKPFNVYLGGGLSVPSGNSSDSYKTGFNAFDRIGFKTMPRVELLLGADIHSNGLDKQSFVTMLNSSPSYTGVTSVEGGTAVSILFAGDLKLNLGIPAAPFNPYAMAGGGVASSRSADLVIRSTNALLDGTRIPNSQTKAFYELGGGLEFSHSFVQVKYVGIIDATAMVIGISSSPNILAISGGVKF